MPPKKRTLSEVATPDSGSRRRSTRITSTGKTTSIYFKNDEDEDDVDELGSPPHKTAKTGSGRTVRASVSDDDDDQYEEDDDGEEEESGDAEDEDEDFGTPQPAKKSSMSTPKRGRGRPSLSSNFSPSAKKSGHPPAKATAQKSRSKSKPRDEDDEDEDEDEDDERRVEFIPLPPLRDDGGVEYEDAKVHPNTLLFLGDLRANNKRAWLKMRDPEYRRSLKDWNSYVETLTEKIIEVDETIPELPIKDVVFRIYRDIRFSKDPTPYKPHYSAAWSRTGRKGPYACYYIHAEPGKCFVGGGLWHPEAERLARMRADIDDRPHRIRRVLTDPDFVRVFMPEIDAVGNAKGKKGKVAKGKGPAAAATVPDEKKREAVILAAFADRNKENALKSKPKNFSADHRDIQLLKLRNFTIGRKMTDEDLLGDDSQTKIIEVIRAMVPFVSWINQVVMPDPELDSDSDSDVENGVGQGGESDEAEEDGDDDEDEL
ncbi:hypothetical protein F5Y16DRAFT_28777 [Xylariaceae sp. FL0255]|nr:hypothetical protein F5Y16DRAFT_28777 [Xylariaceae sp. FL0255]